MNIRNSSKNVFTKLKEPSYFNVKTLLIVNGLIMKHEFHEYFEFHENRRPNRRLKSV